MARSPRKSLLKKADPNAKATTQAASYTEQSSDPLIATTPTLSTTIHHVDPIHDQAFSLEEQQKRCTILARRASDMLPSKKGAVNLFERAHIGLLINYACIGFCNGLLPAMVYPLFKVYLNMESYQVTAAGSMMMLPWSYKTFFGILTDHYPILGYRRKSYILIGWSVCFVALMVLAYGPPVAPYYKAGELRRTKTASLRVVENYNAPKQGGRYLVQIMLVCLGYVITDVACDGVMVELAQHEYVEVRGSAQTTIYIVRFMGNLLGVLLAAFGLNGSEYGGSFAWSLPYDVIFCVCAVVTIIGSMATVMLLVEEPYRPDLDRHPFREMWRIVKQRAIWQMMAFHFLNSFFNNFGFTGFSAIQEHWIGVEPLNNSLATSFSITLFIAATALMKLYFLNASWRWLMFTCSIVTIVVNLAVSLTVTFDVNRNQWFYLGGPQLAVVPDGMRHVISGFVTVEIAEHGFEGATYSLLTTVHNIAGPFASSVYSLVDSHFAVSDADIASDTSYVRWQVATCLLIATAMQLLGLLTLPLLPNQKLEAQELKYTGGSSRVAGVVALAAVASALLWSTTITLLSVHSSTACLRIAGGHGC